MSDEFVIFNGVKMHPDWPKNIKEAQENLFTSSMERNISEFDMAMKWTIGVQTTLAMIAL